MKIFHQVCKLIIPWQFPKCPSAKLTFYSQALMRPGRLDRLVYVPLPDEHTREEILKLRLGSVPLADDVDIAELVKLTHRYSGAEVSIDTRYFTDWRNHRKMHFHTFFRKFVYGWIGVDFQ